MPRHSLFALAAGLLAGFAFFGASVRAQDGQVPVPYIPLEHRVEISAGAQFLYYSRNSDLQRLTPSVTGPDAAALDFDTPDFDYEPGYRAFISLKGGGLRVDAVFSQIPMLEYNQSGILTQGVAFDTGIAGPWLGGNAINTTTLFQPLHRAATTSLGGEGDELEGLSPNGIFADAPPSYELLYETELLTFELNALTADPVGNYQFGLGYRNLQLDETAGLRLTGTFRANDVLAPNNGLSHASLTGVGGLTFLAGTANGFEDEVGNVSGLPDTLSMQTFATTSNDLNGLQGIFERRILYWRGWKVHGVFKAGAYHNQVRGTITDLYTGVDPDPAGDTSSYGRTLTDSESDIAFVGSVGLNSTLPLNANWSIIGGYEVMFISGVALAPDQFSGVTGTTYNVNTDGDMILHGGRVGIQFAY